MFQGIFTILHHCFSYPCQFSFDIFLPLKFSNLTAQICVCNSSLILFYKTLFVVSLSYFLNFINISTELFFLFYKSLYFRCFRKIAVIIYNLLNVHCYYIYKLKYFIDYLQKKRILTPSL